jgi:uncharacterized protein (DUF885 family)
MIGTFSVFLAAAGLAAGACVAAAQTAVAGDAARPAGARSPGARSAELRALLDEQVAYLHRVDPVAASRRGDHSRDTELPDLSPAALERERAEIRARLARLGALEGAQGEQWGAADRTDAGILRFDLSMSVEGAAFHGEQIPISTMGGPQLDLPQMARSLHFSRPEEYAAFASRLEKVPRLIAQEIEEMRLGLAAGRVPPRGTMAMAVEQALAQATPEIEADPTRSAFYSPFVALGEQSEVAARARRAIHDGIVPAYRGLAEFLKEEYIPRCRETIGAAQGIDGPALYDHAIHAHTTLPLTAEEVHRIGLEQVARIRAEMLETIGRSDFARKGELQGDELLAAFLQYLRTDPRFYYTRAGDLLAGYRDIAKRIDAELPGLFGRLPRNPYGVRALPEFAAPSSPTAYYYAGSLKGGVAGYFMANTYRLDQRPKYSMIALTMHEAVPGHHLQISLADELEDQHEYRTWLGFTAFVEGWGLYSEGLGLEMGEKTAAGRGLYADAYDDFGRLSFEMWRACRLVVDTGIHAQGWTRDQGIEYMLAHTALARYDVEREVDRYIGWPGQATGYMIGFLKIRELRAGAERRLGPAFDVRAFHDTVLGAGAVPLPVLEQRVQGWIAEGLARK